MLSGLLGFFLLGLFFFHFRSLFARNLLGLGFFRHLLEAIDATGGVDDLLLAGVERMTESTNFRVHAFHGRTGFKHGTAGARDGGRSVVIRVDSLLHKSVSRRLIIT